MTAREIARDFLSKMNPSGWNGRGHKPDTFNDKDQIKYHVDCHPEIDVDVYYEYDAGDNSWWHFCDARDNASDDKILGVCNPNVWSIGAIEESVKYLFSKMNIEIK